MGKFQNVFLVAAKAVSYCIHVSADIGVLGKLRKEQRESHLEVWLLEPSECARRIKVGAEVTDKEP